MSRHRNVQKFNEDDYDDYGDDDYGYDDDDYGVSPGTMAEYSLNEPTRETSRSSHPPAPQTKGETSIDSLMFGSRIPRGPKIVSVNKENIISYDLQDFTICSHLCKREEPQDLKEAFRQSYQIYDVMHSEEVLIPLFLNKRTFEVAFKPDPDGQSTVAKKMACLSIRPNEPSEREKDQMSHQMQQMSLIQSPSKFLQISKITHSLCKKSPIPMYTFKDEAKFKRLDLFYDGRRHTVRPTDEASEVADFMGGSFRLHQSDPGGPIFAHLKPAAAKSKSPSPQLLKNPFSLLETGVKDLQSKSASTSTISSPAKPLSTSKSTPSSPALTPRDKPINKVVAPERILSEFEKERSGKPMMNLVVIGHVDAGKSTMMGRLLCDLGLVSQKQMHQNERDSKKTGKSSFAYAWVLDETEEERTRGITMDVAQSKFETPNRKVTILDAPGHKDFIPNMITGAAQADVALLVVDSTTGEFEAGFDAGGQTREHTMLVRSLGVNQIAVVVNKLDNMKWNKERFDEICTKLKIFIKQAGFREVDITFVPCSGLTGENLTKRSTVPELTTWYTGPSVIDIIDTFRPPERLVTKPFRMSIGDIFKGMVSGVSVSGRIDSGFLQRGMKLLINPAGETCEVKSITLDDVPVEQAFAGDNVVIILLGCDQVNIAVGNVICDPTSPCPMASKFEARILVFSTCVIPITKGLPCVIHFNNTSEQAVVKKLVSQLNKTNGEVAKNHPRCLTKNMSGVVVLDVGKAICIELYKNNKDLGRFMLRYSGNTIAAGLIDAIL